jgi:riboflavin biosynthesis pyrimidine reductase
MQRLYPSHRVEALASVYADVVPLDRSRFTAINMVTSLDGAVAVEGVSGALGGEADRAAFRALRGRADVILVGAGTARAERYGLPRHNEDVTGQRRRRGQDLEARLAIVSRSLDLGDTERLTRRPGLSPPLVVTVDDAPPAAREHLSRAGFEIVTAGRGDVDLELALEALWARGLDVVLCEGGPRLNAHLLATGLVDAMFVTIAGTVVGGGASRLVHGPLPAPMPMHLVAVRLHEGELLLHYRTAAPASGHSPRWDD